MVTVDFDFTNFTNGNTAKTRAPTVKRQANPVNQPNQEWRLVILSNTPSELTSDYQGSSTHVVAPKLTALAERFRSPTSVTLTQSKTTRTTVETKVQTLRTK